jgi:hypothetical protein
MFPVDGLASKRHPRILGADWRQSNTVNAAPRPGVGGGGPLLARVTAAARLLRAQPDRLGGLCERAALLPAADGGSVLHGLCDAVDVLDDEAACEVLAQALRHPRSTVRKAALQATVRRGDPAGAHTRGRSDPDATIRAWAAKLAAT